MYDRYIKIDKNFKSSVNLQYDLFNEEKILQYVPTTDLCDVIKVYIKMVVNINLIVMNFIRKYKKVLIKYYF